MGMLHIYCQYFCILLKFDRVKFEEVYVDLKWLESKSAVESGVDSPKKDPQVCVTTT